MGLLRLNKDAMVTKLSLALFTEDLEDNKDLGARVAFLEAEFAGAALRSGRNGDALHSLVAAAAAYRVLGNLIAARACLRRADALDAGDAETEALMQSALRDLEKQLAPAPAPAPKPPAAKPPVAKPKPPVTKPKPPEVKPVPPVAKPKPEAPKEEAPKAEAQDTFVDRGGRVKKKKKASKKKAPKKKLP